MKRLKLLIMIFCAALCIPLTYLVGRTFQGLEQEETAKLRYFGEKLFDEMEQELSNLVIREESRPVDEYNFYTAGNPTSDDTPESRRSTLSHPPAESYISGYFQNNPDGSLQTPIVKSTAHIPPEQASIVARLRAVNTIFNHRRLSEEDSAKPESIAQQPVIKEESLSEPELKKKSEPGFADPYLNPPEARRFKSYLGKQENRTEQITARQALSMAAAAPNKIKAPSAQPPAAATESVYDAPDENVSAEHSSVEGLSWYRKDSASELFESQRSAPDGTRMGFEVEVAPLQSVFIDPAGIFMFRRVMMEGSIYRQGFVIESGKFLRHLADNHFSDQPMARFTRLTLSVSHQGHTVDVLENGTDTGAAKFTLTRFFPQPFGFLNATLTCGSIPASPGRNTLSIMLGSLAGVMLIGLFAIYKSVHTLVDLSERRSTFVSSVTHELKTPLTNIRMYVEMLQQGIAPTPEREQDYFNILGSESARLSRLIHNVLELSRLEKQQRHIHMAEGDIEDVIDEVTSIIRQSLDQDGFTLTVECGSVPAFEFDREAMIQILINLIENSIKFGKSSPKRRVTLSVSGHGNQIRISVSDTGPGIPRHALKKVFDDFYRADTRLNQTAGGTGIGLALVKKYVKAMGGTVTASNNPEAGCTISICLPIKNDTVGR